MKIAIMQPYFMPYVGYFQLINAVDEFIIYDNIQFSKNGWINRNRILVNNKDAYITLPLKKDSDFLNVKDRCLSDNWNIERKKILNRISESYKKAPQFPSVFPVIEKAILYEDKNLFQFIFNSLLLMNEFLEIKTPFIISSSIQIDHQLKAQKKVLELCKEKNATTYINPIGGVGLYDKEQFSREGILLKFLKSDNVSYTQFNENFIPFLSIIDIMMFNSKEKISDLLSFYTLE